MKMVIFTGDFLEIESRIMDIICLNNNIYFYLLNNGPWDHPAGMIGGMVIWHEIGI